MQNLDGRIQGDLPIFEQGNQVTNLIENASGRFIQWAKGMEQRFTEADRGSARG
jgi:hypothetical protein